MTNAEKIAQGKYFLISHIRTLDTWPEVEDFAKQNQKKVLKDGFRAIRNACKDHAKEDKDCADEAQVIINDL